MDMSSLQENIDSKDIVVDVLKSDGSFVEKISTSLVLGKDNQNDFTAFEYSIWADLGKDFIFVPHDSRYCSIILFFIIIVLNQNLSLILLATKKLFCLGPLFYLYCRLLYFVLF